MSLVVIATMLAVSSGAQAGDTEFKFGGTSKPM
ncbi:hypothetical protein KT99_13927 [Shewanella benthica KT99]|uniref:Uncharacterized protein n=1 Tax=Shewanella benthica KT99 TaxID=314608 RepID=A9DEP3_9GAMM|nr:hypothetical protein KT99_13927 [Shewanella benthica KT99]